MSCFFSFSFLLIFLIIQTVDAEQQLINNQDCKCVLPAFPRIVGGEEAIVG